MSGEGFASVPEDPWRGAPRRGWPVFGVVFALLVSAGLVWWLVGSDTSPAPAVVVHAAPKGVIRASATADPAQVQRAFEAVQDAYADGGADGLARADADCAAALKADARVLDYCLAFDLFAAAVAPEVGRADAAETRLAQAGAALPPGVDPGRRVAEVRALMRQASLGSAAAPQLAAAEHPSAPPPPAPVRLASTRARPAHAHSPAANLRREEARAAVRALFARAEAAHDAASDADAIAQLYAERTRAAPAPAVDDTAPH